jgi:predicted esterase
MPLPRRSLAVLTSVLITAAAAGQGNYTPPPTQPPDEATRKAILEGTRRLQEAVVVLQRQGVRDPVLADIEIYHKAAEWLVRHNEFYQKDSAAQVLAALDRGMLRVTQAARGESPWLQQAGTAVVRAYRSRIDNSLQPYAVTFPTEFGRDPAKKWRLDVVLHGRDTSLTEAKFLKAHDGSRPAAKGLPCVQLEVFGRGNNAYRWAGETDVWEAIDHFLGVERTLGRESLIDLGRVVLRGFSMGGAGSWHLGLHKPDRWCVVGPGAGFTTTRGYWKDLPETLPPHQAACLHIYDAVDYAENAFDVPVVSYGGDQDAQLQASRNIQARLETLKIPMQLLVAPGVAHRVPPEWAEKWEVEIAKHAAAGRREHPEQVRFVTYTLKYPGAHWVELLALGRHYEEARVEAKRTPSGYTVTTKNVKALRLTPPPDEMPPSAVTLDGQEVPAGTIARSEPVQLYFEREGERWRSVLPQRLVADWQRQPRKQAGLTGPIDDAFTESFLCVRPTGESWHPVAANFAEAELARFRADWSKYFRGEVLVKDDTAVTAEDIATRNLVLFGDPASNALTGQVIDRLPLTWTKDAVGVGGKSYPAAAHVAALIYPNPLNPRRYVVLNSGHTFRTEDLAGTNARLFPRLGDFAVLKPAPTERDPAAAEVAEAGLFDDEWKLPK